MATYLSTRTSPPPHIVPPSVRDEEIDLRTLMGTLADSKKMILFGTLMFLLVSVLYVVLATAGDVAAEAAPLGKPVLLLNNAAEPAGAGPLTSEMPNVRRIDVHEQTISDVVLNLVTDRHAWELLRNPEPARIDACERIVEALAALRPATGTVVPLPTPDRVRLVTTAERMRGVS